VQPVGRHQVARLDAGGGHVARVPLQRGHPGRDDRDADAAARAAEWRRQHGAANAQAVPVPERRVGLVRGVEVADAAQRVAVRRDAERREPPHCGGMTPSPHALSTGAARGSATRDRQARERAVDRSGKTYRPPPTTSTSIMARPADGPGRGGGKRPDLAPECGTVSSAALSTVKTHAVIHADPVSGRRGALDDDRDVVRVREPPVWS